MRSQDIVLGMRPAIDALLENLNGATATPNVGALGANLANVRALLHIMKDEDFERIDLEHASRRKLLVVVEEPQGPQLVKGEEPR